MTTFAEIQSIIELAVEQNSSFDTFGLRSITEMPNGEVKTVAIGDELEESFHWDDGMPTDERLGGTSVISFDVDTLDGEVCDESYNIALELMSIYKGGQLVIVGGRNNMDAILNDIGESVLSDAIVVAIVKS